MKPINLRNLVIAKNLSKELRDKLFALWGIKPKYQELNSLEYLVNELRALPGLNDEEWAIMLSRCYFGFEITNISKEFDCLWISDKSIVNIELKSVDVGEDRIKKQLLQNKYYLRHLSLNMHLFTCVTSNGNCYKINGAGDLVSVPLQDLAKAIVDIRKELLFEGNIEILFPPERYLVSPFNSTDAFLRNHYFLTNYQNEIKNNVLAFVNDDTKGGFYAINGGPGTGKSLLIYDIARTLMNKGKKVVIGHAGLLNDGHSMLIENGWNISQTKEMVSHEADVCIIDEAQRCYNLKTIINLVKDNNKKCIFSYDPCQLMRDDERNYHNEELITANAGGNVGTLKSKIRTNKYVYNFIKALFDKSIPVIEGINKYVELTYCSTREDVLLAEKVLTDQGYELPIFTPRVYGREEYEKLFPDTRETAHAVIGQEFDKVAALISPNIHYDENGKLVSSKSSYYNEWRMLYQILTRARHKVHLIIFNNPQMLERCLELTN